MTPFNRASRVLYTTIVVKIDMWECFFVLNLPLVYMGFGFVIPKFDYLFISVLGFYYHN